MNGKAPAFAVFLLILRQLTILALDPISIRMATADDFETVYRFVNLLEDDCFDRSVQQSLYLENMANPGIIYLLAFSQNEPVGFASCHIQNLMHHAGKIGEIQEMYVAEEVRSLGIGKMLLDQIKAIAKEKNVLQLEVTSSLKREAAHHFYEREKFIFTHKKFTHPLN